MKDNDFHPPLIDKRNKVRRWESKMKHYDRVSAWINLDHVEYNLDQMKKNISSDTKMIAVIKADGYGHGAVAIANLLEPKEYLFGFAVATAEEALILRRSGIKKPILILGYTFPDSYQELIEKDIRLTVFREDMLRQISDEAKCQKITAKVHVKVDTGMNRIGITPDERGIEFVKLAKSLPNIEIEGMFTHFAKADEKDKGPAKKQIELFHAFCQLTEEKLGFQIPYKHCSNSAGIVELKKANMDLVRAGITLYGLWPSEEVSKKIIDLKPVLSLKSQVVYLKEVEKGTPVSYGGTYMTKEKSVLATIPVGYGDGYPRSLSNKGYVLIRGQKAPITGRVCMDQFMVDVTGIQHVQMGDDVTLIGTDGTLQITMEELSLLSDRFNYEFACDLGKRIPRVFTRKNKIIWTKDYFDEIELLP